MTLATLYLLAFGMKAAAFPVNFWLPASYHTPQIVTSALFGGLLTKVGIYALLRVLVMLMPAERLVLSGADRLDRHRHHDPRRRLRARADRHPPHARLRADLRHRRDAGRRWRSATPRGLAGAILYAIHSMVVMTALYLLSGMIRDAGGSFSLD